MRTASFLSSLVSLGERQREQIAPAIDLVCSTLQGADIPFKLQEFDVSIPVERSSILLADRQEIPCTATSFVSGVIESKEIILSSAMPMAESPNMPNINVNPFCPVISRGNHYWFPSVAITHSALARVLASKDVRGEVEVEMQSFPNANVLVGNLSNPSTIVFTHFDSIGPGANDNASGVSSCMESFLMDPSLLEKTLFVLSSSEELSDEKPYYWGAGYRQFQEEYAEALRSCEQVLVVDSVGSGEVVSLQEMRTVRRAFPMCDEGGIFEKTTLFVGSMDALMAVYHSELDTISRMSPENISKTAALIFSFVATKEAQSVC